MIHLFTSRPWNSVLATATTPVTAYIPKYFEVRANKKNGDTIMSFSLLYLAAGDTTNYVLICGKCEIRECAMRPVWSWAVIWGAPPPPQGPGPGTGEQSGVSRRYGAGLFVDGLGCQQRAYQMRWPRPPLRPTPKHRAVVLPQRCARRYIPSPRRVNQSHT